MRYKVIPKTNKAKKLIIKCGDVWKIIKFQNHVQFDTRFGPWFYMEPDAVINDCERWVHSKKDKHFDLKQI